MTGVAVLGAVLAGVLTAPLLRARPRTPSARPWPAQADLLARLPRPAARLASGSTWSTADSDVVLGVVDPGRRTQGAAAGADGRTSSAALRRGRAVSTSGEVLGEPTCSSRPARLATAAPWWWRTEAAGSTARSPASRAGWCSRCGLGLARGGLVGRVGCRRRRWDAR